MQETIETILHLSPSDIVYEALTLPFDQIGLSHVVRGIDVCGASIIYYQDCRGRKKLKDRYALTPVPAAPVYQIRTVADFAKVPRDRRQVALGGLAKLYANASEEYITESGNEWHFTFTDDGNDSCIYDPLETKK